MQPTLFKTKTITVFNRHIQERDYLYKPTVIKGVHVENMSGAVRQGSGYSGDSSTLFIIPFVTPDYVSPKEYKGQDDKWTLDPHSIIIVGEYLQEIKSIHEVRELFDVVTNVMEVTVYDHLSDRLNHFEVIGR